MTQRHKVLMLTTQLGYGGAETSFIRLANFLAESMDVTVALFTSDYGQGAYTKGHEPLNAKVVLLDKPDACGRLRRWMRRIRAVRALKAQHHVSISFLSGPNVVNTCAGYNHGTIISLRGSRMYDPVAPVMQRRIFQYVLDPLAYWLAARIVPVSAGLRREICQIVGKGILEKVEPISPFVEIDKLPQRMHESAPEPYAQLVAQKVIVAAGRLSVEKGFHHLIRVFADVAALHPGTKLMLVGDGPMLTSLRALCEEMGLPMDQFAPDISAVLFTGYQKNVLPLMSLGSVYAMTSATEGFPSVLLEAMAVGVPVVAANTPWGVRSILSDAEDVSLEPYPTQMPTRAAYGMLMPRIDLPMYQRAWSETLAEYVRERHAPDEQTYRRVHDFDISVVGARWRQLIETMIVS